MTFIVHHVSLFQVKPVLLSVSTIKLCNNIIEQSPQMAMVGAAPQKVIHFSHIEIWLFSCTVWFVNLIYQELSPESDS